VPEAFIQHQGDSAPAAGCRKLSSSTRVTAASPNATMNLLN
jgi:hypothetical protein